MYIHTKRQEVSFRDITIGECFYYVGDLYMRICVDKDDTVGYNAIDLVFNSLAVIDEDEPVAVAHATITIES